MQCSAVQLTEVQCNTVQYSKVQYSTVQCSAVLPQFHLRDGAASGRDGHVRLHQPEGEAGGGAGQELL